ncbi:F0F1 ATP synthase subunit delta [Streptococcus massiliensis]|uniref:ATP synthase subunit delta n=1 Tax=Streptococcus massiliensis TaxID=313439 RepID=A0A380L2V5_9STRE|nr:F0F1 ATP synthase subunit delta [Streptococcus massiliensis]SUN76880.1 ATP synthase F0F1 subunit delta [Streptococcus massiliensis]
MDKRRYALIEKYATPFVQVVIEQGQQAAVFEVLSQIKSVCQETNLADFLAHIGLEKEEKVKCLQLFQSTGSQLVDNLLSLLIENNREDLLYPLVVDSLSKLEKISNEFEVTVKSTQALSEVQKERLLPLIEKKMGLKVRSLKEEEDANLIGGFVITANNKTIDASIKHQLQAVKENLK